MAGFGNSFVLTICSCSVKKHAKFNNLIVRRNGSTYGAFQSKDPILAVEKGAEMEGGSDEHGISVHHPTS